MTQLQRGARTALDQVLSELDHLEASAAQLGAIRDVLRGLPLALIKFNPELVADRHAGIQRVLDVELPRIAADIATMRGGIRDQIAPMLARNERNAEAASIPDRLAELERRFAALESERGRVVPFRQASNE